MVIEEKKYTEQEYDGLVEGLLQSLKYVSTKWDSRFRHALAFLLPEVD